AAHQNPREIYVKKLVAEGSVDEGKSKEIEKNFKKLLQDRLDEAKQISKSKITSFLDGVWKGLRMDEDHDFDQSPVTAVKKELLLNIGEKIARVPANKKFFNKIESILKDRQKMLEGEGRLDWAMGELLAYGTLLSENYPIRFSGQDVERGTFSHRHAVIKLEDSEEEYVPLNNLERIQAKFDIYNSLLSEYGVLGFEYGYAMATPHGLTIWEAQFGDFNNCAQVIFDQYLSAAEDKWRRMNGICVFLPHGYEGQGAEHSSARMERFLHLCAQNNMYVVNVTTPANFFHCLRRQLHSSFRKPLIAFTPKSLLRHPKCVSTIAEFTEGGFKEVFDDHAAIPAKVKELILCTGKIYYELLERKEKTNAEHIAIIRLEQLYPFPKNQINDILKKYNKVKQYTWVQEEPENMGAWAYMLRTLRQLDLQVISRKESASPATGSSKTHVKQQQEIIDRAFASVAIKA
ncbi:MAG: 2-oxoglutarate dehydrogenase E1 component, partial [Bacteroidota bacterium]